VLTAKQFLVNNLDSIEKESEAILNWVSDNLISGYFKGLWDLRHAPYGSAEYVATQVANTLSSSGWLCEYSVGPHSKSITITVKPNVKNFV
ncbi:hypothetical protein, partial [Vibrio parahaemolyticus]|uniref:hypothetical protein n=1 Tax=Vibrio parahaemolyticus TaxID=670 RepID=UPI0015DEC45B